MPHALGQNQGDLVSVSERTADGFELATLPAQAGHAVDAPLDAFIDLRGEPDGLAVDGSTAAPRHHHDRRHRPTGHDATSWSATSAPPSPATRSPPPSAPASPPVVRFGSWHHKSYVALSLAVPVLWVLLVAVKRGYEQRYLGRGPEEYRRLWEAGLLLFITMAVLSFSVKGDVARGYVCLVVPLTLVADRRASAPSCAGRSRGCAAAGSACRTCWSSAPTPRPARLFERLRAGGVQGLRPVGIYPHSADAGGLGAVLGAVEASEAHMVAVVADPELSGQALRELSWELEERHVDLVVDPGLLDVAGTRLSIHPMADLSLLARAAHAAVGRADGRQGGVRPRAGAGDPARAVARC